MSDIRKIFKDWAAQNFAGLIHVELDDDLDVWCVKVGLDAEEKVLLRCHGLDAARDAENLVCDFIREISRQEEKVAAMGDEVMYHRRAAIKAQNGRDPKRDLPKSGENVLVHTNTDNWFVVYFSITGHFVKSGLKDGLYSEQKMEQSWVGRWWPLPPFEFVHFTGKGSGTHARAKLEDLAAESDDLRAAAELFLKTYDDHDSGVTDESRAITALREALAKKGGV